jgi:cytochrome c553
MHVRTALLALFVAACGGPSTPPESPPPAPTPTAPAAPTDVTPAPDAGAPEPTANDATPKPAPADETGTPRERLMKTHFKETAVVRAAVIKGSLNEAVAPAEALTKMEGLGTPDKKWQPALEALQNASRRIGQSPDIPGAAAATADIGVACGSCHRVAGGPKVTVESPPPVDKTLQSRMRRHVWATERLWEALYVPSDASWKAGTDALSGDPFPKEILDKGGVHSRSAGAKFKSIVATAGSKKKVEDRAKVYASLLETCSACHVSTGGSKK